ncbi:MAG: GTPase Era [Pseudomonadota bacterium]|nr:GTPase Era [Pseudomonadota bacterium]
MSRCGYIGFIGRPNVGKSSLLNALIEQKLSITTRKPQTTRHHILAVDTRDENQFIFVDTPGLHKNEPKAINRSMNRSAMNVIHDVNVIVFVVDSNKWNEGDEWALKKLELVQTPVILAINKVDKLDDKGDLLPIIESHTHRYDFADIIPVSAKQKLQLEELRESIAQQLPEQPFVFDPETLTDRSSRFFAAEIIREKAMKQLGDELPYELTIEIEQFEEDPKCHTIHAAILVERDGQKGIVIGKQGQRLKAIGTSARKDMERLFDQKVMLKLWVKVKSGWSDDERSLKSLGYD